MTTLGINSVKELLEAGIVYQIHSVLDKMRLFEQKYRVTFPEFESAVNSSESEDFLKWDDYLEWKGLTSMFESLEVKRRDIESGNFTIA